jgi:hypothetical protein
MPFKPTRFALVLKLLPAVAALTAISCGEATTGPGGSSEPGTGGESAGEGGGTGGARPGTGGSRPDTGGATGTTGGTGGSSTGGQPGAVDASSAMPADAMASTRDGGGDVGGPPPVVAGKFRHPGVLVNKGQLDLIRDKVKAGQQPQKAAYDRAMAELGSLTRKATPYAVVECGPYSSPDIGCSPEINDASAAYALAIAWNVTGDEAYAKKAIEVMNAWSHTLKSHANHNAPLQTGWAGAIWPVAGEIMRYTYTGWAPADVAAFSSMLKDVYLPTVIKGNGGNGNWELVMIEAAVAIAVFLDDKATFDRAIEMWRKRVPAYIYVTSDGAHPPPAPTGSRGDTPEAIKSFWYNVGMYVDGVAQETCRDFGHAEYGIASVIAVAETAFQQGLDLYKEHSQRLRATLELHADYTLGRPAPSWLCGGKLNTRLMPTWEIGYNHYHDRLGMELPLSLKLIESRIRGLEASNKHMVWETLTHAGVGWAGLK